MRHPNLYIIAGPNDAGHSNNMSEKEYKAKVNEGLKVAYRRLVEEYRRTNTPLIFSENGVVKYVDPFTVEI